jgi:hypothetical protein
MVLFQKQFARLAIPVAGYLIAQATETDATG